jgi:hypothetical protein
LTAPEFFDPDFSVSLPSPFHRRWLIAQQQFAGGGIRLAGHVLAAMLLKVWKVRTAVVTAPVYAP